MEKNIADYTAKIKKLYSLNNTTEHSFRPFLYNFFKSLYPQASYTMTNEPRRIKCGAPDYVIQNRGIPVGYIETKDIIKNLDLLDDREKDQFNRYTKNLDNIIYTNYLNFRLYRNHELIKAVSIGEIKNGKLILFPENYKPLLDLMQDFVGFNGLSITSAEILAKQMARKAREFANSIIMVLTDKEDDSSQTSTLQKQYNTFKNVLIENLDPVAFAGMYAQTVAYGLFAARLNDNTTEDFSRDEAVRLIPRNNQFLRSLFESITGSNLDPAVEWIVDDLTDMFRHTDIKKLLKTYGQTTAKNDPFIHFYETFLNEYDPEARQKSGVYYTPKPVVNFIVKSIDFVLKNDLNVFDGLANTEKVSVQIESSYNKSNAPKVKRKISDRLGKAGFEYHKVQILDPAVGTGTFPVEVIRYISNQYENQRGLWNNYVKEDLLPRINGFEFMMVPYTICHLKFDLLLQETGYNSSDNPTRLNIFLTDTLEKPHDQTQDLWSVFLTQEAEFATIVKKDKPIMVVLGNPPYNASSNNNGKWIKKLIEIYKKEPNSSISLQERNTKHLNDDYVKFIRYAQYLIDKNKEGVIAYINPHGYLDAITMRGMRWSLLNSFDSIYVLNLHGNTNKGESTPDGSVDQNVFDIMQGVCINIFIKKNAHKKGHIADVYYADLYGKRTEKFDYLYANDVSTVEWQKLTPKAPNYFMTPQNDTLINEYRKGIKITELFPVNCPGFTSHRDVFAVTCTKQEIIQRFNDLIDPQISDEEIKLKYNLKENNDWNINGCRAVMATKNLASILTKCNYRPFDFKWCCLSTGIMNRPRKEIVDNVLNKDNVCIITTRQQAIEGFNHIWVSDLPTDKSMLSTATREGSQVFPLYLYEDGMFNEETKRLNIKTSALDNFCKSAKIKMVEADSNKKKNNHFTPIELIYYIYAVLSAEQYSKDYSIYLKSDYPYIPIPKTVNAFFDLASLGKQLAQITMMKALTPKEFLQTTFNVPGTADIENIQYKNNNVYINDTQFFGNISEEIWNYTAGRHQPAQLWLKHRKGRILTYNEIIYYQQMISAIQQTIEIKKRINDAYLTWFSD